MPARGSSSGRLSGGRGGRTFRLTGSSGKVIKAYRKKSTSKSSPKPASKPSATKPRPADDGWSKRPPMSTQTANKLLNQRDARKAAIIKKRSK